MKYKNFDGYKINESKIMNSTIFSEFELSSKEKCEFNIFKLFPNHSFYIILKSGRGYLYGGNKGDRREKVWDLETLEKQEGRELKKYSIIGSENGQFIKEQYQKMSNLEVVDIIQFIKKDTKEGKKKQRRGIEDFDDKN